MNLLPLPITVKEFNEVIVSAALKLLPNKMDSLQARVLLSSIALQESNLSHRWQVVDRNKPSLKGPARGLLQFEKGTKETRGGIFGIYLHPASSELLKEVCESRGVFHEPSSIWKALESDDVLSACCGRLLLYTDSRSLPSIDSPGQMWDYYLRNWRPGKPKLDTWAGNYQRALHGVAP